MLFTFADSGSGALERFAGRRAFGLSHTPLLLLYDFNESIHNLWYARLWRVAGQEACVPHFAAS
jgi:hypothetical protein